MAWYDEPWDGIDDFFGDPPDVNDILFGDNSTMDPYAQELMWQAMVDKDDAAYNALVDYMWDKYGLDFEDAWDWQDFAEWYESQ